jgi:hypothetical protein
MYAQSFFVTSVRGIALEPTTSERVADGCIGFMNAALGFRFEVVFFLDFVARFFAGMHLSFRETSADPSASAPRGITITGRN